ncbi:MAG: hypothetical protein WCE90_04135 [Candidatus Zixiibacteriota bacterium]
MDGRLNFLIRGKFELTKKRLQIDGLLRRARKGEHQAHERLFKEFGIRVYSPGEVETYVKKRLRTEVVEELPARVGTQAPSKVVRGRKTKLIKKR